MGYTIVFNFVKDSDIDPNEAFLQNIKNFQSDLSLGFIKRYSEIDQDERDKLLKVLFDEIENIVDITKPIFNRMGDDIFSYVINSRIKN